MWYVCGPDFISGEKRKRSSAALLQNGWLLPVRRSFHGGAGISPKCVSIAQLPRYDCRPDPTCPLRSCERSRRDLYCIGSIGVFKNGHHVEVENCLLCQRVFLPPIFLGIASFTEIKSGAYELRGFAGWNESSASLCKTLNALSTWKNALEQAGLQRRHRSIVLCFRTFWTLSNAPWDAVQWLAIDKAL